MTEEIKDKTIKSIPVIFWNRFAGKCKTKGLTITQGFMIAARAWMKEGDGKA